MIKCSHVRLFVESTRLTGSAVAIFKMEVNSSYRKLACELRSERRRLTILADRDYPTLLKSIRRANSQVEIANSSHAANNMQPG